MDKLKRNDSKDLKLGLKNSNAIEWNVDWNLYENTLKKLYFNILKDNSLDFVYINFILKPIEIVYNVAKSGYYLFNSLKHNTLINFVILLTAFLNFLTFLKFIKKKTFPFSRIEKNSLIIIYFSLIISLLSLPILFYPFIGTAYFELLITLFISSTICIINIFSK